MVVTAPYRSGTHAFRHGGTGTDDGPAGGTYTGRVDGDVAQVAGEEDVPAVRARGAAHPLQGRRRGRVRRTGDGHARLALDCPFHAVGGGDEAVELDVRVDLVRRADPAVAHDGGAGHVVQSEPVQDGRGGVAGGVGHVLVAQADAVQGPVPAPALHAAGQGQSPVVVEHQSIPVHAVAFDVGEQLVGEGLGQWYGAAALLGLGARAVHAVAERRAFDALGQSLDLAFRQVLGLPFDQDDEPVAVAPEFVFGQAQPFALAHAGHEGQHPHEPPGVVGLRGDEVGGLFGRQGGAFLQRHAGRGALDGGVAFDDALQYGVLQSLVQGAPRAARGAGAFALLLHDVAFHAAEVRGLELVEPDGADGGLDVTFDDGRVRAPGAGFEVGFADVVQPVVAPFGHGGRLRVAEPSDALELGYLFVEPALRLGPGGAERGGAPAVPGRGVGRELAERLDASALHGESSGALHAPAFGRGVQPFRQLAYDGSGGFGGEHNRRGLVGGVDERQRVSRHVRLPVHAPWLCAHALHLILHLVGRSMSSHVTKKGG